jgi:glycosyltransferase involved in cell wall biosynthesis
MRDFLADDRNALLHRPKSPDSLVRALRRALDEPDLRARLAGAALQTVREQFDADALFDRYAALIESTAAAR